MDINDIFGNFPNRPDSPQFWRLSSIVLRMDGRMDEAMARGASEDEKQEIWESNVRRWVDPDVLNYMAMQRAMRLYGGTRRDLITHMDDIIKCNIMWQEGFQYGAEFATQPLEAKSLDGLDTDGLRLLLTHYEAHVRECHEKGVEPQGVVDFFNSFHTPE